MSPFAPSRMAEQAVRRQVQRSRQRNRRGERRAKPLLLSRAEDAFLRVRLHECVHAAHRFAGVSIIEVVLPVLNDKLKGRFRCSQGIGNIRGLPRWDLVVIAGNKKKKKKISVRSDGECNT